MSQTHALALGFRAAQTLRVPREALPSEDIAARIALQSSFPDTSLFECATMGVPGVIPGCDESR